MAVNDPSPTRDSGVERKSYTGDRYLDFAIENAEEITSLIELWSQADKKLSTWVDERVTSVVKRMTDGYFEKEELGIEEEDQQICWFDPNLYDRKAESGAFFGYELGEWELPTLVDGGHGEGGFLYLYVREKKTEIEAWRELIDRNRKTLARADMLLLPSIENDRGYLAVRYLNELRMPLIRAGELDAYVERAVREFTGALLPIARRKPR